MNGIIGVNTFATLSEVNVAVSFSKAILALLISLLFRLRHVNARLPQTLDVSTNHQPPLRNETPMQLIMSRHPRTPPLYVLNLIEVTPHNHPWKLPQADVETCPV